MKISKIKTPFKLFSNFNLRTITIALCLSLIGSCAYESYPVDSSYGTPYRSNNHSPYRNNSTASDPTIPLVLGATAVGALAYYGKKKHDRRRRSQHYYHGNYGHYPHHRYSNYHRYRNNHYTHRNNYYSRHRSHSNHYNHRRSNARRSYRDSARDALIRKRNAQNSSRSSRT